MKSGQISQKSDHDETGYYSTQSIDLQRMIDTILVCIRAPQWHSHRFDKVIVLTLASITHSL
jgi:hypothetical protein